MKDAKTVITPSTLQIMKMRIHKTIILPVFCKGVKHDLF